MFSLEFEVIPDIVNLSFAIEEESADFDDAMVNILDKLSESRNIVTSMGISEANISSDSVGSNKKEIESKKGKLDITFHLTVVLRIRLEENNVAIFSNVLHSLLSFGLRMNDAPVYDLSELTKHRNVARTEAAANAKDKALNIVSGFNDANLALGSPLIVSDFHVDIDDDSDESFSGMINSRTFTFSKASHSKAETKSDEHQAKKARVDESRVTEIFKIPPVRVCASVKVLFALVSVNN